MRLVFTNTLSHKRAVLLSFELEFAEKSIVSKVYYRTHHGWAQRKIFNVKVLRRVEDAILRDRFLQIQCHRRATLLIFEAEFTESV